MSLNSMKGIKCRTGPPYRTETHYIPPLIERLDVILVSYYANGGLLDMVIVFVCPTVLQVAKKFGNTVLLIRASEMIEYCRWLNFSKPDIILVGAFTTQEQSSFAKPYNPVRSASTIPQSLMDEARILVLRNPLRPLSTDLTHTVSCGALSKGV